MSTDLGRRLNIRARVYVAGQVVPFFWPMRTFISRNPLHELEHLPFPEALERGATLFRAKTFLPRREQQALLSEGRIDRDALRAEIRRAVAPDPHLPGIDLPRWTEALLTEITKPLFAEPQKASAGQIHQALQGRPVTPAPDLTAEQATALALAALPMDRPMEEVVDALFGGDLANRLDQEVIRACQHFFDEGQSVWDMPDRDQGFFCAWRAVAGRRVRRFLNTIKGLGGEGEIPHPERVIDQVMGALGIPQETSTAYFTRTLLRLQGWSGFIRWRSSAKRYHWAKRHPGDLVDLLAVRLALSWPLLEAEARRGRPTTRAALADWVAAHPFEALLRLRFFAGQVPAKHIRTVEAALARSNKSAIEAAFHDQMRTRRARQAEHLAQTLTHLAVTAGQPNAAREMAPDALGHLLDRLTGIEAAEGMIWLRAAEAQEMRWLLNGLSLTPPAPRAKRPFVQAAFCIDVRSERIRRHLEAVGDYQTFGIAGFFGVPLSLLGLGKGSEQHLCPVLLTPRNLALEMTAQERITEATLSILERAVHELKETVLAPFVTVEAIGLLFGFDMVGKTIAPEVYHRLRRRLHPHKPHTHLMIDKLTREQADSVVRAVQRAVILEAVARETRILPEELTDDDVRALREAALAHEAPPVALAARLKQDSAGLTALVQRLRTTYRITRSVAEMQMEYLGRVGFSLDEQVGFVHQALASIGLTQTFSRFILLVGHGSTSQNNPYESALDCGACGGADGMTSARALAFMANKVSVRRRLRDRGIDIPEDAWFVPALHNTTTDDIALHDLELLPASHLVYLDRLRAGLGSAARLCAQERQAALMHWSEPSLDPKQALRQARHNAFDWSQVRPEWGLARNAHFVIGRRNLTEAMALDGQTFLHSYDWRCDPKRRLLENILTGPLIVAQWINLEYYFSTVDNERFGSGSKIYHNVVGHFGVMRGNLSDLRTGLPAQTVMAGGRPYHRPQRLITVIEAPISMARKSIEAVVAVKHLVQNGWIRVAVADPETGRLHIYDETKWIEHARDRSTPAPADKQEVLAR